MSDIKSSLKRLGYSDKEIAVYLAVLSVGPAPVRKIAAAAEVNRGTTYDILKALMEQGLVSYYHQAKKQYFVAESPERLLSVVDNRVEALGAAKHEIAASLPELNSMFSKAGEKPVVKYYEGLVGVRRILEDVLETVAASQEKTYSVYSSANIREVIYKAFPDFTKRRIDGRISVRVISLGSGGGEAALSERRWLTRVDGAPAYILIYGGKTAMISLAADGEPRGVMLEDPGTSATERLLFEGLWSKLPVGEKVKS